MFVNYLLRFGELVPRLAKAAQGWRLAKVDSSPGQGWRSILNRAIEKNIFVHIARFACRNIQGGRECPMDERHERQMDEGRDVSI